MKKIISIASRLFIAAVFTSVLFTNCENFNTSGNMRDKLQEETKYTNAPEIKVSFVIGTKDSGQFGVNLPSTLKKGYSQDITFRMDEAHYHFREWIAYNNYLTDKQEVVPASQIKIYEPNNQTTKVELLDKGNLTLVTLVPFCDTHPGIVFSGTNLPDNAVLSPVNSYQLVKEENLDVSLKLPEEYGFEAWNFYSREVSDASKIPVLTPEDLEAYAPLETEETAEADSTEANPEETEETPVEKPARPALYIYKTEDAPLNTDANANNALALFYKETSTESTSGETKNSFIFRLPDNLEEMIYVIPAYYSQPKANISVKAADEEKVTVKPAGQSVFKIGKDYTVTSTVKTEYGFKNWDFSYNKSSSKTTIPVLTQEKYDAYKENEKPSEYFYLTYSDTADSNDACKNATAIIFDNADNTISANSFILRFQKEFNYLLNITPVVYKHPTVNMSIAASDMSKATMKPSETRSLQIGNDFTVNIQTTNEYGYSSWKAYYKTEGKEDTLVNVYTKDTIPPLPIGEYVYVCQGDLEKTKKGELISAITNSLAVIYNNETEVTDNGQTKLNPVIRFFKAPVNDQLLYVEPVLFNHPKVNFKYDLTKATMKPAEQQTLRVGSTLDLTVQTQSAYGFKTWEAWLLDSAAGTEENVPVYSSDNIPESVTGNYIYVCKGSIEKTENGEYSDAAKNALAVLYNSDPDVSASGATKVSPTLRIMSAPENDRVLYIQPVLFNHPQVSFSYDDQNKATVKPGDTKTLVVGTDLDVTVQIQKDYGFRKWNAALGSSTQNKTNLNVYTKDSLPSTLPDNYVYVCEGNLEKTESGEYIDAIKNAAAVIYNTDTETTDNGITKVTSVFRFMKVLDENQGLYIEPELYDQPKVNFTVDTTKATMKPAEQQTVHVDGTVALTIQTNSEYGYSGWTAKLGTTSINIYDKTNIPSSVSGDYVYVCNGELEKTESGSLVSAIQNSLAVIYNAEAEISSTGVYKATPTLRLMKAPADNAVLTIEPVLFNHPKVNFAYDDTNKATIKPAETKTLLTGVDLEATLLIQNDYGFKKWTAALGTTAVPVYDKDTLPETTEGNYIYICEGSLEKDTDGVLVSGIQNALAVIYNSSAEEAEGGVTKLAPTFRFMKITGSDEILTIKPELFNQPKVDFTVDTAKATLKPTEQQTVHVGGTVALTIQTNSEYGYSGFNAKLGSTEINVYNKSNIPETVEADYIYVCNGDLEKTESGSLVSGIENALAVIYNAEAEISSTGVYKAAPTLRLMKAPADNAVLSVEPVLFNHPKVNFAYDDTNKASIKPTDIKTLLAGADLEATLLIQNDYGFKKWTAELDNAAVNIYDKNTLPETTTGNYIYVCEGALEKDTDGALVSGIQNALAVIYNSSAEETEGGITKLSPTFRFIKITGSAKVLNIKPELFNQPKVDFTVDTAKATLKPTEQQTVHVGGTVALTVQTNSEYGFNSFNAKLGSTRINVYNKNTIPSSVSGDYVYVCNGDLEKTESGNLVPAIQNSLAVIYNAEAEISSTGVYKATPTLRLMKAPADNAVLTIEPVLFNHPKVNFAYDDTNKATIKPAETKTLLTGSDLEATLLIQNDYGFKKWTAELDNSAVNIYDKNTLPDTTTGNYIYVCEGALEKDTDGALVSGIQNALAVIYNSSAEETEGGITKLSPTFRFMKITGSDKVLNIKPELFNQPKVDFTVDTAKATFKPSEQQTVHVGGTVALTVQTNSEYGLKGWNAKLGSTAINVYNKNTIPSSVSGDYVYVCNGDLEKTESGSLVSAIQNALAVIYNAEIDVTDKGLYKASPTLRLMNAPTNNQVLTIEPDLYAHPKVNFNYDSDKATLKPAELNTVRIGSELDLSLQIQSEYGFNEWKAYLVNETTHAKTEISVCDKDHAPSSLEEDFIYVASSGIDKVNGQYPSPVNKALAIIYNNYEDVSETGTAKLIPVLTFLKAPQNEQTLLLEPVFKTHPKLGFTFDEGKASIRPYATTPVRNGTNFDFTLTTDSDYGFSNWNAKINNSSVSVYDKNSSIPSNPGKYVYVCQGAVEMNSSGLYYSDSVKNAVAVVYNSKYEIQSNGSVRLTPSVLFMNGASDGDILILEPVLKQHPYVKFQSDSGKYSLSPNGTVRQIIGNKFKLEASTSDKYSFLVKETGRDFSDIFVVKNETGSVVSVSDYFDFERLDVDEKGFTASVYLTPKIDVSDFTIEAKTVIRPQITFSSPSNNSSDVYKNAPIKFIFSKEFNSNTEFQNYIKLTTQTGGSVAAERTIDDFFKTPDLSKNKLFLTIRNKGNNLPDMTYITVTVDGNLKDSSGICLGNDYSFTFLTGYQENTSKPLMYGNIYKYGDEINDLNGLKNDFSFTSGNYASVDKRFRNEKPFDNLYIDSRDDNLELSEGFLKILAEQGLSKDDFNAQHKSLFKALFYVDDSSSGDTGLAKVTLTEKLLQAGTEVLSFAVNEKTKSIKGDGDIYYTIPAEGITADFDLAYQKSYSDDSRYSEIGFNFNIPVDGVHEFTINAVNNLGLQTENKINFIVIRDTAAPDISAYQKKVNCNTVPDITVEGLNYYTAGKVLEFEPSVDFIDQYVTDNSTCASLGSPDVYFAYGITTDPAVEPSSYEAYQKFGTGEGKSRTGTVTLGNPEEDTTYYVWLKLKDQAGNESKTVIKNNDGPIKFNVHKTCPEITDVQIYDASYADNYGDKSCSGINKQFYLSFKAEDATIGFKTNGITIGSLKEWISLENKWNDTEIENLKIWDSVSSDWINASAFESNSSVVTSFVSPYDSPLMFILPDSIPATGYGKYKITIKAEDFLGNITEYDQIILVDRDKPVINGKVKIYDTSLGDTTIGKSYTNEDVTLEFTVVETGIGIKADGIQITGLDEINSVTINNVSYSSTEWNSVDFRTSENGSLNYVVNGKKTESGKVSVTATDNAGNISTTVESDSITYDGTAPVISFFKIYDDSNSSSDTSLYSSGSNGDLLIKLELQDAESGLAENGLLFNGITNITYSDSFDGPYSTTIPIINQDTALKTIWIKGSANSITTVEGLEHFCVSVVARNALQVESSEKEATILLDTTAPTITVNIYDFSAVQLYGLDNDCTTYSTNGDVLLEIITRDTNGVGFKQNGIEIEGFSVSEIYSDKEKVITDESAYTPYSNNYCEISNGAGSKSSFRYYLRGTLTSATTGSGEKTLSVKVTDWLGNNQTVSKEIYIDTEVDSFTVTDVYALKDSLTGDTAKTHYVDESGEIFFKVSFNETRYFPANPVSFDGFTVTGYKTLNGPIWISSSKLPVPLAKKENHVYYVKGTLDVKDAEENNFVFSSTFTDLVGNTKSTGSIILPIDTTAPTLTMSELQDAKTGHPKFTSGVVKFKITASDLESGLSTDITYTGISGITYSSTENGTYTSTVPYSNGTTTEQVFWVKGTIPTQGSIIVKIKDTLEHFVIKSGSINLDNREPRVYELIPFDTDTSNFIYSNGDVTLKINVDDQFTSSSYRSGIKNIYISGYTGDIKYFISDGSYTEPESESEWVTSSSYTIPVPSTFDAPIDDYYLFVKGTAASSSSDSSYKFKVWAEDMLGNIGDSSAENTGTDEYYGCLSVSLLKDTLAPTVTVGILNDTDGRLTAASNGDITFTLTVQDTNSGLSSVQFGGFDTTKVRTCEITYYDKEKNENVKTTTTISAGLPTIINFDNTKYSQAISISGTASDASPYTITYSAVDRIGNTTSTGKRTIVKDVTPPTVTSSSFFDTSGGANVTSASNGDVTVKFTVSDSGIGLKNSGIKVTGLSNSSYCTTNSTNSSDWTTFSSTIPVSAGAGKTSAVTYYVKGTATASDSKYTVNITFTDRVGNQATLSKSINVDTAAPRVYSLVLKDTSNNLETYTNGDVTLKSNIDSPGASGFKKFYFKGFNTGSSYPISYAVVSRGSTVSSWSTLSGTAKSECYIDLSSVSGTDIDVYVRGTASDTTNSYYTFTCYAEDKAGNSGASSDPGGKGSGVGYFKRSGTITKDKTAPTGSYTLEAATYLSTYLKVTYSLTGFSDSQSGVEAYQIRIWDTNSSSYVQDGSIEKFDSSVSKTITYFSGLTNGKTYDVDLYVYDKVGNYARYTETITLK